MRAVRFAALAAGVLLLAAAAPAPAPAPAAVTFTSRVPYEPLRARLVASGGSLARVVHVQRAADLDALLGGRRYKFALSERGRFAVAPLPADAPSNEYVHPILAEGTPVLTAGTLRVERDGGRLSAVILDEDSKSYCPTFESLMQASRALQRAGVAPAIIRLESRKPECAPLR